MEEVPSPEDELLMRYYDGELSPSEQAEVRARLERDPAARAALAAMSTVSSLVREAVAAEPAPEEGADAALRGLYDRVAAGVRAERADGATDRGAEAPRASAPRLRAIPGGLAPADGLVARRRRIAIFAAAGGFVAAAAAVALGVVVATGSGEGGAGDGGVGPSLASGLAQHAGQAAGAFVPGGSEVVEVHYGDGAAATQFTVETGDTPVAVIWINDEAPPETP